MPIRPFPGKSTFRSKEFIGGPNLSTPFGYLVAYIDGGARGNPGPAGYGVVIEDEMGRSVVGLSEYLGKQTNNYAEYAACWRRSPTRSNTTSKRSRYSATRS